MGTKKMQQLVRLGVSGGASEVHKKRRQRGGYTHKQKEDPNSQRGVMMAAGAPTVVRSVTRRRRSVPLPAAAPRAETTASKGTAMGRGRRWRTRTARHAARPGGVSGTDSELYVGAPLTTMTPPMPITITTIGIRQALEAIIITAAHRAMIHPQRAAAVAARGPPQAATAAAAGASGGPKAAAV